MGNGAKVSPSQAAQSVGQRAESVDGASVLCGLRLEAVAQAEQK